VVSERVKGWSMTDENNKVGRKRIVIAQTKNNRSRKRIGEGAGPFGRGEEWGDKKKPKIKKHQRGMNKRPKKSAHEKCHAKKTKKDE